ncbi:uncharacterized protein BCR38DRAFT_486821 [Pseudomassariella vexata]|uniref:NAD-dependent epimerase/dehydratase domain-containing protein n=1 Tax=Pseudomassariella vexata TaxID=1141098 RepID=A0A1Y2DTF4_9PEZI|nr:uncharacterized protein BCR38DRAFT_486821 [Pseudomassariella vexata]ORY62553.1 hypothetical protein BCR38DRAFT_486821 [Pseudomassariella vexata]
MATAAVIGSTGLVGGHILSDLLGLDAVKTVHTLSRRAPKAEGPKLSAHIDADITKWASALSSITPTPDIVFSALGTTRADAGGIANQWKIDHDLNVELAKSARAAGVKAFIFISSAGTRGLIGGAAPYSKMKQGVEDTIKELDFEQAIILRPGLILGDREKPKAPIVNAIAKGLGSLHKGLQDMIAQEADEIGRAAVNVAMMAREGKAPERYWIVEGADIIKYGREEAKSVEEKGSEI